MNPHRCLFSFYFSELSVPFPSKRIAEIVYDVIRVDPEPKKSHVDKEISLNEEKIQM